MSADLPPLPHLRGPERAAGVLLHPTSLPGPYGVGEIGRAAHRFLEWMDSAGLRIWQLLPLTPVGMGGCPYASPSAMAREPLLLCLDTLVQDGWLLPSERPAPVPAHRVNWAGLDPLRRPALRAAADRVCATLDLDAQPAPPWLDDYALHRALVESHGPQWTAWPEPLRHRDDAVLSAARDAHQITIRRHRALQWLFQQQWDQLRAEARRRGIALWGDLPFFVGLDSHDVWANPELWRLDPQGRPEVISGVPPDAFSAEGQLWGHPLYEEAAHRAQGFKWWIERMEANLSLVDVVRIDHFRGVEAVWEVRADAPDARGGRWIPGPGAPLLDALRARFPAMPFLAEDLGHITDEVRALQSAFDLPGMVILQFAFADGEGPQDPNHPYLPHQHRPDQVVYTGTHDNNTTLGWYRSLDPRGQDRVRRYLSCDDADLPFALVRAAWRSPARTAILPMQDLLSLDGSARMNIPGTADGNWAWRMGAGAMNRPLARRIAEQVQLSGR